jgi:predicted ArsR family transcriptional regulator
MPLDELVHQSTRLRIVAYLYENGATTFPELRQALDLTEGNLSSHLRTLEDADVVAVEKTFVDRRPQSTYRLTDHGTERVERHAQRLADLLADAR